MDKIFEKETVGYLLECGVRKDQVAKIQLEKCENNAIKILEKIIELLKTRKYDDIKTYTEHSSAGDGYGQENDYINFGSCFGAEWADISELVEYLRRKREGQV